jgi:hypothetical protein
VTYLSNRQFNFKAPYSQPPAVNPDGVKIPPNAIRETWLRGRQYHQASVLPYCGRSDAQFCLSHYYWFGDSSLNVEPVGGNDAARNYRIMQRFNEMDTRYSHMITRKSKHLVMCEIKRCTKWRPPNYAPFNPNITQKSDINSRGINVYQAYYANKNRATEGFKRLRYWFERLCKRLKRVPTKGELFRTAKANWRTIEKNYIRLWLNAPKVLKSLEPQHPLFEDRTPASSENPKPVRVNPKLSKMYRTILNIQTNLGAFFALREKPT